MVATVGTASRPFTSTRLLRLALLLVLGGTLSLARPGATGGEDEAKGLEPRHQEWLEQVAALLTDHERQAFLGLHRDYRRDAFIERFWVVRDPYPETRRNEFRNAWERRLGMARERFGDLETDRAQTLLLAGPPRRILTGLCPQLLRPLEIWAYSGLGSWPAGFSLVFVVGVGRSPDGYGRWSPARGVDSLISWHHVGGGRELAALEMLASECSRGAEAAAALGRAVDWERLTSELELAPQPDGEWVDAFLARSTEVPEGAEVLPASLTFSSPGRRQSRTVVQALITVPTDTAAVSTQGPETSFNFLVDGEVLRQAKLFESFRYRFDIPSAEVGSDDLPLIIQRYLRPNEYTLVVKVEDLNSHRVFRIEQKVQVPVVPAGRRRTVVASAPVEPVTRAVGADLQEANQPLVFGDHCL